MSYQGVNSKGTVQEIHKYDLFPPTGSHKVGSETPIRISFDNPFDPLKIRWGEIQLTLAVPNTLTGRYTFQRIVVNGQQFQQPQIGEYLDIAVHTPDNRILKKGQNEILIYHNAPFGAGTPITQDASISGQMLLQVDISLQNEIIAPTGGTLNLANTLSGLSDKAKENTPVAIAVIVLVAVIIVALAYIIGRTGINKNDVKALRSVKIPGLSK